MVLAVWPRKQVSFIYPKCICLHAYLFTCMHVYLELAYINACLAACMLGPFSTFVHDFTRVAGTCHKIISPDGARVMRLDLPEEGWTVK
jgi:hypothetical protein